MKKLLVVLLLSTLSINVFSTGKKESKNTQIAIFIPGVVAGSPIYEELESGTNKAAMEHGAQVKTIEGGFNPGDWPVKIKEIAATGLYDLIISSNPSIPEIFDNVSKEFPNQKFICLDGELTGNPQIYTAQYKQFEQAYLAGYMAGLVTLSNMKGANSEKKVGFIYAHSYPVLDNILFPGFLEGLKDVDPEITVESSAVGNWWDATKASELTSLMIDKGVDVFLSISGGATQGVITQAQDKNKYVVYFDSNGYSKGPGTVIGSTVIRQEKLAYETVSNYLLGKTRFGTSDTLTAKDGFIDFIQDDPLYIEHVPHDIRQKMSKVVSKIKE